MLRAIIKNSKKISIGKSTFNSKGWILMSFLSGITFTPSRTNINVITIGVPIKRNGVPFEGVKSKLSSIIITIKEKIEAVILFEIKLRLKFLDFIAGIISLRASIKKKRKVNRIILDIVDVS